MTKILNMLLALTALVAAYACTRADAATDRSANFDRDWKFMLADSADFSSPDFNDSSWRQLDLPHDWAIEGDFSIDNPSGTGGGALPGGIGWYRKTFSMPALTDGEKVYIDFDGVYMNSTVYINGHELGTRPYGYASFSYDITPWLREGDNVIAVRVDNSDQPNSRWYSGCGIYRNVWLRKLNAVHVAQWGSYVTAEISGDTAVVKVETTVDNTSGSPVDATLVTSLLDPQGKKVGSATTPVTIGATAEAVGSQEITVADPQLWTLSDPALYTVVTDVVVDGKTVDTYRTTTGLRTIAFDAEKGFFLNGERVKIKGVCLHHDLGALGAAVNTRALRRQLEIMQEMGVNAFRASHNPPAPEMLALCDSMGILVMDEAFDMWRKRKTERDYARFFDEWHEKDLSMLVRRDRNHPSVIMWSIGNEVLEQWSDAAADTLSLEEANLILNFGHSADQLAKDGEMSVNSLLTKKLVDIVKSIDPTRPVTAGMQEPNPGNHLIKSGALDIIGVNYHDEWYDAAPENYPGKPFLGSETVSALMTRGHYNMPSDSVTLAPKRWDLPYEDPTFACSSYDNMRAPWGSTHENSLRQVESRDHVMGQFIWTGFDYLGEPTPYGWPARSSYFGIVDLAGFPKDVYYMYQSEWRPDKTVLHLFPHWNWTPGQEIDMWAYYNNADEVELFVNGESKGVKSKAPGEYHVMWRVPFEPGEVKVVSRKEGKTVAERVIATAGAPAKLRLTPDRTEISADGNDLSYVTVEVLDKDGNLCPLAENEVHFTVEGAGRNEGVDNGSPISLERFKADSRKAMAGKAMLIVRNNGSKGAIKVTATSEGLHEATATITAR